MSHRRFTDRNGHAWEVRERSRSEWELAPVAGNPNSSVSVPPPGYESDPYELSEQEMQRLLESAPKPGKPKKSPFID